MHDVFGVQGDVGLGQGSTVTGIERCVPLFVLVTEAHHHKIGCADQGFGANRIDLG